MLVLLAAGVIVTIVVLDRHALGQSVSALGSLDLRWFLLAIVCEFVSLVAFGLSRRGCCGPTAIRPGSAR